MSRSIPAAAAVAASALLLAACGGSSYSRGSGSEGSSSKPVAAKSSGSGSGALRTASDASLGAKILVDSGGMTLYRLSGESASHFICTSQACLAVWHPLQAGASAPSGVASLGTVKRPDGSEQVSYEGGPLYTFASDKAPGQTNGEGLKDVGTWGVVKVGGSSGNGSEAASESGASSEPGESSGSSSGGGGEGGYRY